MPTSMRCWVNRLISLTTAEQTSFLHAFKAFKAGCQILHC